ncbi:MAG: hypothetical protein IK088_01265 [Lachnospiraceae bacterium]|nr:hypothetical protein [Lachnospiraceae bacterium]
MADHTLPENLTIIRSTGVYGPDIRTAIADAIVQADTYADERIQTIHDEVQNDDVRMNTTKIAGTEDDYLLEIVNPS